MPERIDFIADTSAIIGEVERKISGKNFASTSRTSVVS
jgi:hypothetical protein